MTAQSKLRAFASLASIVLLANVCVVGFTSRAAAFCSSCNGSAPATYSAGYAAPVAYQAAYAPAPVAYQAAYAPAPVVYQAAYAPAPVVYTTAYAPVNTGWYPGRFLGRVNRSIWGVPTTTYYAPTYTAAYAPTYMAAYAAAPACSSCSAATVSYAPSYAPTCSTCSASYAPAPACSTCSACSASYAPACSTCSTCDACAASSTPCASCAAGAVSQAAYTSEVVDVPAAPTFGTQSGAPEPTPAVAPDANIPPTREVEKPTTPDPLSLPEATTDATDDSATNLQAPKLFDPNDRTAQRHPAPVWTAVYHKVGGAEPAAQPVSWQQVERDAEGWSSASE